MNPPCKRSIGRWLLARAGIALALAACAATADAVGVRTLNYTGRDLNYIAVEEPGKPGNAGGGDGATPYSSGGHVCCFGIPDQWHPGLKVVVIYQLEPEEEKYRRVLVEVPPYAGGKAGDIWLIVHEDESVEAVVSNFGPSRPEWPGRVKGYPVPTREYRLKRWEEILRREKAEQAIFEKAIQKPDLSKEKRDGYQDTLDQIKASIRNLESHKP